MIDNSEEVFDSIVESIREAGYDPYSQLTGFLQTGDLIYITRKGNARSLISQIDRTQLLKLFNTQKR